MDKDQIIILLIFDIRKEKQVGTRGASCLSISSLLNASVFSDVTTTKGVVALRIKFKSVLTTHYMTEPSLFDCHTASSCILQAAPLNLQLA